jgi:hypothetical protein
MLQPCVPKNVKMATVSAKVFKHHQKSDGTFNVKICLYHKGVRKCPFLLKASAGAGALRVFLLSPPQKKLAQVCSAGMRLEYLCLIRVKKIRRSQSSGLSLASAILTILGSNFANTSTKSFCAAITA